MSSFQKILRKLGDLSTNIRIKKVLLKKGGIKIGNKVTINRNVIIESGKIEIGDRVVLSSGSRVSRTCILGEGVYLNQNSVLRNCKIGKNSYIDYGAVLVGKDYNLLSIGKESSIGKYCILDGSGNLKIGNSVHITSGTSIWTHSSFKQALSGDKIWDKSNIEKDPVVIEDNIWIGGNCTVYPGVTIHEGSAVMPNSVVIDNVESNTVVSGIPAKPFRKIVKTKTGKIKLEKL